MAPVDDDPIVSRCRAETVLLPPDDLKLIFIDLTNVRNGCGCPFLILIFVLHHESLYNLLKFVVVEVVLVELTLGLQSRDIVPHH